MSKYKNRKTLIYQRIMEFDGKEILTLDAGQMEVLRALLMGGYLEYDESYDGMRVVSTDLGQEVLNRE